MEELNRLETHRLVVTNRRTCNITGVTDVLSFDISEILLETEQGMLMLKGQDLHVNRLTLDKGEIDVEGKMDSFTYSEPTGLAKQNESFFGKLFK